MLYALNEHDTKVEATPGGRGTCPGCGAQMVAKCGAINIWHWAHESRQDCDPWWEPESEWHRWWKQLVSPDRCEVVKGQHRADMIGAGGVVIELQHSSISPCEIAERERFYGHMIWVFDVRECYHNMSMRPKATHWTFRWKHARKSIAACTKPVYLDFGRNASRIIWNGFSEHGGFNYEERVFPGRLFLLKKMHPEAPVGGWGCFVTETDFIERVIG